MTDVQTRRAFLAATCGALLGSRQLSAAMADIRVGITVDTRPDWNGAENFLRSIVEASQVGYRWIETFWPYVERWEKNPQELKDIMLALGLRLETVSNGGGMNADFADPAKRNQVLEDHMRLVQFIRFFDCDHLKINCGRRIPGGHTGETYREMSKGFTELGKRTLDTGYQTGCPCAFVRPVRDTAGHRRDHGADGLQSVWFVHDTHQTTMAGIDPVELTKIYGSRTIEYHLKDAPRRAPRRLQRATAEVGGRRDLRYPAYVRTRQRRRQLPGNSLHT